MDAARIAALLEPFLSGEPVSTSLSAQIQTYLELLLRWNARINLTAIRDPEQIVTRHFGESLFAARTLRNAGAFAAPVGVALTLADIGSGAGFPGIPIKLFAPEVHLTLIESQSKKATFLREVIRTAGIKDAEVFCGRAENWSRGATIVTMRAVERFQSALPVAASLTAQNGTLCLLVGASQIQSAQQALGQEWQFSPAVSVPESVGRVIIMGKTSYK